MSVRLKHVRPQKTLERKSLLLVKFGNTEIDIVAIGRGCGFVQRDHRIRPQFHIVYIVQDIVFYYVKLHDALIRAIRGEGQRKQYHLSRPDFAIEHIVVVTGGLVREENLIDCCVGSRVYHIQTECYWPARRTTDRSQDDQ